MNDYTDRNYIFIIFILLLFVSSSTHISAVLPNKIPCNRNWDVLQAPKNESEYPQLINEAAALMGSWNISFAGSSLNQAKLRSLVPSSSNEPLLRSVREKMGIAIDLYDFLLFLDDLLLAGKNGYRQKQVWITSGRLRKTGITIHPDDVFKNKPRQYGVKYNTINIEKPKPQANLKPAPDGSVLGPRWTRRYLNASGEKRKIAELSRLSPSSDFASRVNSLIRQLRSQGVYVVLESAVRKRERGYLMWGAFALSRCKSKAQVKALVKKLDRLNKEHKLNIDIVWYHPKGWKATIEAARQMTETYDVVYATQRGAFHSNHYDAVAVDITAPNLPRKLTLKAPSGKVKKFNFSDPGQTRDMNLTPELIDWIEENFYLKKLRSDYPHWDNSKK